MPNRHRIAQAVGITLHTRSDPHPCAGELPPKHTWSGKTIFDVAVAGEKRGLPEHIYDVLGVFLLNDVNRTQLYGDAISGVSRWMLRQRIRTEEMTYLRTAFEELDMRLIRQSVHHHGIPQRSPQIAFLVADHMEAALWALRQ